MAFNISLCFSNSLLFWQGFLRTKWKREKELEAPECNEGQLKERMWICFHTVKKWIEFVHSVFGLFVYEVMWSLTAASGDCRERIADQTGSKWAKKESKERSAALWIWSSLNRDHRRTLDLQKPHQEHTCKQTSRHIWIAISCLVELATHEYGIWKKEKAG